NGSSGFQGSYDGNYASYISFDGITTDEMYLIRAEAYARTNKIAESLTDLNTLLLKRYATGTFPGYESMDQTALISLIKDERRKELVYRGLRWSDLRRYNLENDNITLTRVIGGVAYTLPPNDLRWV